MSYTFLQEQGEESSAESFSDIPAYVLSKLNLTAAKSSSSDNGTASYLSSQSGMMSEPLTVNRGEDLLMSSAEGSPVRTLAVLEKEGASMVNEAGYGLKWQESFAKFDPNTSSWKTPQSWLFADLEPSLETWPFFGLMLDGECLEQETPERHIDGTDFGFWPTPTGVKGAGHSVGAIGEWGGSANPFRGTSDRNLRCPDFEEWMMGWPESWTALTQYATDKFQQWLSSHGKH